MKIFLCGCQEGKQGYPPERHKDTEDFQVCPEHGEREQGWRTTDAVKRGILIDSRDGRQ